MTQEVKRNYLEINSLKDLNQGSKPSDDYSLNLLNSINFQLNKFFYKNIGNKHKWVDRLIWTEEKWIEYLSCLLYTSPSPRDRTRSRMPSSA